MQEVGGAPGEEKIASVDTLGDYAELLRLLLAWLASVLQVLAIL